VSSFVTHCDGDLFNLALPSGLRGSSTVSLLPDRQLVTCSSYDCRNLHQSRRPSSTDQWNINEEAFRRSSVHYDFFGSPQSDLAEYTVSFDVEVTTTLDVHWEPNVVTAAR